MINDPNNIKSCMYKMIKTKNNKLIDHLIITGLHSILVDTITLNDIIYEYKIDDKYMLIAGYSNKFIKLNNTNIYTYYHLVLEDDDINKRYGIYTNGILSESTSLSVFNNSKLIEII